MAGTVIRIFDKMADAQNARNELLNSGFPEDSIELTSMEDGYYALEDDFRLPSKDTGEPNRQSGKGLKGLVDKLTGKDEGEDEGRDNGTWANSDAVQRGTLMMTVSADDSRLGDATEIMDRFNAVDIERRTPH